MENNQYIPLGVNHASDDNLIALIETYGMEGYGVYIALLFELRKRTDYVCALRSIPTLARRWEINPETLQHIVYDFNLFAFAYRNSTEAADEPGGEPEYFCSSYLFELMNPLEQKRAQCVEAGKVRAATVERAANGRFTSVNQRRHQRRYQQVEKSRTEEVEQSSSKAEAEERRAEEKRAEEVEQKPEESSERWELLLQEAFDDQSWLEVQAMHSGMRQRFFERLPDIVEFFKMHVRTYGKEGTIFSASDAKSYFSNFVRQGSPARKTLDVYLEKRQSANKQSDPYRYEQHDPLTGRRTYCGRLIPADAPPRPHENAVWNDKEWS